MHALQSSGRAASELLLGYQAPLRRLTAPHTRAGVGRLARQWGNDRSAVMRMFGYVLRSRSGLNCTRLPSQSNSSLSYSTSARMPARGHCHINYRIGDHGRAKQKRTRDPASSPALCGQLCPCYPVPGLESSCTFLAVGNRLQAVPARTDMVSHRAMSGEQALRRPW